MSYCSPTLPATPLRVEEPLSAKVGWTPVTVMRGGRRGHPIGVVGDIIPNLPYARDEAEGLGEVDIGLAERGVVVIRRAVIVDPEVVGHRIGDQPGHVPLVALTVVGAEVE